MTKRERTLWDDLVGFGRELLDKIDETLVPRDKRRKPARIPIPARKHRPHPQEEREGQLS